VERNHQVYLMSELYHLAERVLIWLGAGNDKTDAFMQSIEHRPKKLSEQLVASAGARHLAAPPYRDRFWVIQKILLA
jgi:hypothetical protein